jgi:hypothetical protein
MKIEYLVLKAIKDDILKNNISISMELERTPANIKLCEELSQYKPTNDSSGYMTVTFEPRQLPLL